MIGAQMSTAGANADRGVGEPDGDRDESLGQVGDEVHDREHLRPVLRGSVPVGESEAAEEQQPVAASADDPGDEEQGGRCLGGRGDDESHACGVGDAADDDAGARRDATPDERDDPGDDRGHRDDAAGQEGIVGLDEVLGDLRAEREQQRTAGEARRDREGRHREDETEAPRGRDGPWAPAAGCRGSRGVARHEPDGHHRRHREHEQHPVAQVHRFEGVLHERTADEGREGEAHRGCRGIDRTRPGRLSAGVEFDHGRARRAQRQADPDALEHPAGEEPADGRGEREEQDSDGHRDGAGEERRAAADVVGDRAEDHHGGDEADRVEREDDRDDRGAEVPFRGIQRVDHCRSPARPEGEGDDRGRRPEAGAIAENCHIELPCAGACTLSGGRVAL